MKLITYTLIGISSSILFVYVNYFVLYNFWFPPLPAQCSNPNVFCDQQSLGTLFIPAVAVAIFVIIYSYGVKQPNLRENKQ